MKLLTYVAAKIGAGMMAGDSPVNEQTARYALDMARMIIKEANDNAESTVMIDIVK